MRVKDSLTNAAVIGCGGCGGCGTTQGYSLSPVLFNICAESMPRAALSDVNECIRVGGHLIKTMRYADDQATIAGSAEGLQQMVDKMQKTAAEYGMKINIKKTKVMKISKLRDLARSLRSCLTVNS